MLFSAATTARTFIIRLEDGEILHETIERFAREQGIRAATLTVLGGADAGSRLVVGPADGRAARIEPMEQVLDGVHEIAGTGTLFPGPDGGPVLHMHIAAGRAGATVTGCVRRGVKVWQVMEVVLTELTGTDAARVLDPATGFALLRP